MLYTVFCSQDIHMQHACIWSQQGTLCGVPEKAVHYCQFKRRSAELRNFLSPVYVLRNIIRASVIAVWQQENIK